MFKQLNNVANFLSSCVGKVCGQKCLEIH